MSRRDSSYKGGGGGIEKKTYKRRKKSKQFTLSRFHGSRLIKNNGRKIIVASKFVLRESKSNRIHGQTLIDLDFRHRRTSTMGI